MRSIALGLFALLLNISNAHAFIVELGVKQPNIALAVTDYSRNILGVITSTPQLAPNIAIKTNYTYFNDSPWGYFTNGTVDSLYLHKQKDSPDGEVNGSFWHITPYLMYTFHKNEDIEYRIGGGLGLGYLDLKGQMYTNNQPSPTLIDIDKQGFGYTTGLFVEVERDDWTFKILAAGPLVKDGTYKYGLTAAYFTLSYQFDSADFFE